MNKLAWVRADADLGRADSAAPVNPTLHMSRLGRPVVAPS